MLVIKDVVSKTCGACQFMCLDLSGNRFCDLTSDYTQNLKYEFERHENCPIVCELPDDTVAIIGIQKGDTNLDVLKAAFPDATYTHIRKMSDVNYVKVEGMNAFDRDQTFYDEWCNAQYERGKK